ncbi:MAG: NUDIX domain-containing protein [Acidobacteria bacterium]|nr:NUDIX domain-containing protein [Acidobacteriota bacterium]
MFLISSTGKVLLQRPSEPKYHSAGLWSACEHPRPGEPVDAAAPRQLREEMTVDCALAEVRLHT